MNTQQTAKKIAQNTAKLAAEPFETLRSQVAKPLAEEMKSELGSFFGMPGMRSNRENILAQEELRRARTEKQLEEQKKDADEKSQEKIQQIISTMNHEYKTFESKQSKVESSMQQEFIQLQEQVSKLAKTAGVETKSHLQNPTKKIGVVDIKFLTAIVRFLRIKTEESKSAKDLQSQRQNAKRTTGMLAWVTGKQMKVHEQGTLTLQG